MKKVNFKVVLMALSFAFSFLFLGMDRVEAQTVSTLNNASIVPGTPTSKGNLAAFALPQGSFQGNQAALDALMAEMISLKAVLAQIPNESDPTFVATARLVRYYAAVHQSISNGQTVAQSIVLGLTTFTNSSEGSLTNAQLMSLRNAAIALLD